MGIRHEVCGSCNDEIGYERTSEKRFANLDRLSRNVAFISKLMDSGVEFVAADMPHANRLTVRIFAAVAEHEREAISTRTNTRDAATR
jgi:DNA invertase Pin-like site-specific DNA recombinase